MKQREHKYRALDTELEKWVYFTLEEAIINKDSHFALFLENYCQFTGLTDKNRKETYEGDIVRNKHQISMEDGVIIEWSECVYTGFNITSHKDNEVIGNIYENKKLLK